MPRQNRYHPYSSKGRHLSQCIPQPANLQCPPVHLNTVPPRPTSLSTIPELDPMSIRSYHTAQLFQPIFPPYIQGTTTDGLPLVTKSILQGPDGVFHIQMQVLRYPSERYGPPQSASRTTGIPESYERLLANGPGPTFLNAEPNMVYMGAARNTTPLSLDSGLGSSPGSDDGKSVEDEDAPGEEDTVYGDLLIGIQEGDARYFNCLGQG